MPWTSSKFKWFWSKHWIFFSVKNNIYHQIGIAHVQHELTWEKDVALAANRVLVNGDAIKLVNNAFAYCFKEVRLSTTGDSVIEHNKNVGHVSNIMRALTTKGGDLLSHFDTNGESEAHIEDTSLHHHLINNHDEAANKGNTKEQLPLEHVFGFLKTFE